VSILPIPSQYSTEISSQSNQRGEKTKGIQKEEEEVKLYLFSDDIILFLKDPKNSTKKLLTYNKHFQQSSRIQNQFAKISSFSIYQH
jgi:hypothetical protein